MSYLDGENYFILKSWSSDKRLTWASRLLLSKLYNFTHQGKDEAFVSTDYFKQMGFSEWDLRNSWALLQKAGYISKRIDKINGNKSYVRYLGTAQEITQDDEKKIDTPIEDSSSHHTKVINNSNTTVDLDISPTASVSPVETAEITQQEETTITAPAVAVKPQSKAKKLTYPKSAQECEAYFLQYIEKYSSERPILKCFPLRMEADKFFNYWAVERAWKRGRVAVKSVSGCVATWCGNWIDRNQRNFENAVKPPKGSIEEMQNYAKRCCIEAGMPYVDEYGQYVNPAPQAKKQDDVIEFSQILEMVK